MALDVAAARAAVGRAALARDEEALRAIADSLPALAAYGYERHRARAFANAIRGAHDSAVAELCLGVAACAPAASTFVADSAQLKLLSGQPVVAEAPLGARSPRAALSAAALAAAVATLALLPAGTLDDAPREAAGITAPAPSTPPRVVVVDPPTASPLAPAPRVPPSAAPDTATATLVRASVRVPLRAEGPPRPAAVGRAPRPARPPLPAPAPAPPSPPPSAPAPAPAPAPPPPAAAAPAAAIAPAVAGPRAPRGKALGHAHAPGQLKKGDVAPPAPPPAEAVAPPAPAPAAPPHPRQGNGRDQDHGRGP
jgi:hypothetical protein